LNKPANRLPRSTLNLSQLHTSPQNLAVNKFGIFFALLSAGKCRRYA
jgi:hypothetical protein